MSSGLKPCHSEQMYQMKVYNNECGGVSEFRNHQVFSEKDNAETWLKQICSRISVSF